MTRDEVTELIKRDFGCDLPKENPDSFALFQLRHKAVLFPAVDAFGNDRDTAEWVMIDAWGKIDTGKYGEFYYYGTREDK